MKTYDELYDYIKCLVDNCSKLGYLNEPYDVTDWRGYVNYGALNAYSYVLGRLEEIRKAEESQTNALVEKVENLGRALAELESQTSELYVALCEAELDSKKGGQV